MKKALLLIVMFLGVFEFANAQTDTNSYIIKKIRRPVVNHHPAEYTYTTIPNEYIEDVALGIDFQHDAFNQKFDWDMGNNYQNSNGFNVYFQSGNKFPYSWNAGSLMWGGGFGVTFYKNGPKSQIEFNTTNKDSGFTRLEISSPQLYVFGRYEYRFGPFVPFFGWHAGVKWFNTNQHNETYIQLKDYQNTSDQSLKTTGGFYIAPEFGLRLRLGMVGSIVMSNTWIYGGNVDFTNMANSHFNGLAMDLKTQSVQMNMNQWKLGFLFDLSSQGTHKKLVRDAYTDTTFEEEITQIYKQSNPDKSVPCPCCKNNTSINSGAGRIENMEEPAPTRSYPSNPRSNIFGTPGNSPGTIQTRPKPLPGINPGPTKSIKIKS